jgi:hypothetical protein
MMKQHESPDEFRDLMDRLDRALPPHSRHVDEADADPLMDAARRLAQGPDISLSDPAQDRIEALLRARTAALHTRPATGRRVAPRRGSMRRLIRLAVAACLIIVLATFGTVRASANTLPGDTLYPVKRAVESGRLALVSDDGEPGLRVTLAERRIGEFGTLLRERRDVYPRALEEAIDQLNRTMALLAAGYGDAAALGARIASLTRWQTVLINQAAPLASPGDAQRLQTVAFENAALQVRVLPPEATPDVVPQLLVTITPSPAPTSTPTLTPMPSPTATPTALATETEIPVATTMGSVQPEGDTPQGKPKTPKPSSANLTPTRTPPGHGPTPGLGHNPPGHGGNNPGNGNNGKPPGQDKDKK